tara:strand:+ start:365 stop:562 length:198 start_codon:yes stop_codon:yes gene_type:complete
MLKKQSIRSNMTISRNGKIINKDEMIEISQDFTELEEAKFRKMLQQGGTIKMRGSIYEIKRTEKY